MGSEMVELWKIDSFSKLLELEIKVNFSIGTVNWIPGLVLKSPLAWTWTILHEAHVTSSFHTRLGSHDFLKWDEPRMNYRISSL